MPGYLFVFECYRVYISNDLQLGIDYADATRQMFKDCMSVEQVVDYNGWRERYADVAIPRLEQTQVSKGRG